MDCVVVTKDKVTSGLAQGLEYLERNCRPYTGFQTDSIGGSRSTLEPKYFPESIFSNLMALDLLPDLLPAQMKLILRTFIAPEEPGHERRFCVDGSTGKPVWTGILNFNKYQKVIPDDTEDTALYHYIYLRDKILDKNDRRLGDIARLTYLAVEDNGLIQMYFPPLEKARWGITDAGSMINALRYLYFYGTDSEMFMKSEDYVYDWLVSGKYLNGTRYYPSPDVFLFFCAEAVSKDKRALARFEMPLLEQIKVRMETLLEQPKDKRYPMDYASCILALASLNRLNDTDVCGAAGKICEILLEIQRVGEEEGEKRGGWQADALYKRGKTETYLGGSDISTIFCVAALHRFLQKCFSAEWRRV